MSFSFAEITDCVILFGILIGLVDILLSNRNTPDEHEEAWGDYPYVGKEEK